MASRASVLLAAILVGLCAVVATAQQNGGRRVFLDGGRIGAPMPVDLALLADARVQVGARERPAVVRLNLAPAVELVAEIDATGPTSAGYSLTGRLVDGGPGTVTLVVNGDVIAGSVVTPDVIYEIRPAGDVRVVVRAIDPATLRVGPGDAIWPPRVGPISRSGGAQPAPTPARPPEDGTRIDVLVFFTAQALVEEGGGTVAGVRAVIDALIVGTNRAYADSGVVQRLNLAAPPTQAPFRGTSGGSREDDFKALDRFSDWKRGRELRDRHSADLVALVVGSEELSVGGVALQNAPGWPDWSDEWEALQVYSLNRAHTRILAHELGHNMGLNHERYQLLADWQGPGTLRDLWYPSGVGFAGPIDNDASTLCAITIMAYGTECFETQEPRWLSVERFSNPNHRVGGVRIGVPGNRPSGATDGPAFAARHLNRMRRYVANYRRPLCLRGGARIRLQANSGHYVVAAGNGGGAVVADQPRPGPRGRFTVVDHNGGPCVESGDVVSLHTSDGFYLRAARGGGGDFDATAPRATPWARFVARRHRGSGAFRDGDVLTLQTHSGHYVTAEEGGGEQVRADRTTVGAWERWRLTASR